MCCFYKTFLFHSLLIMNPFDFMSTGFLIKLVLFVYFSIYSSASAVKNSTLPGTVFLTEHNELATLQKFEYVIRVQMTGTLDKMIFCNYPQFHATQY